MTYTHDEPPTKVEFFKPAYHDKHTPAPTFNDRYNPPGHFDNPEFKLLGRVGVRPGTYSHQGTHRPQFEPWMPPREKPSLDA
mmetsp:Transcript_12437/g.33288  ORF Transcript_12437/g.33288 Transcript_12437/m.33288 type:complete len:82 (-) Transcript_12437:310-555(-)